MRQAGGALQLPAKGQHWRRIREISRKVTRQRGKAPPPAQHPHAPVDQAEDGIIEPTGDRPVMRQETVDDAGELVARFLIAKYLRLAGAVAAGHDQRTSDRRQQQMMQRRIRQHQSDRTLPGRRLWREAGAMAPPQKHDRRGGMRKRRFLFRSDMTQDAGRRDIRRHHRQRLGGTELAPPQFAHRFRIGRIAGDVEAADPLHRQDAPGPQPVGGG